MGERSRSAGILTTSLVIGLVLGAVTEGATPWLSAFLGVSSVVVLGIGLAVV